MSKTDKEDSITQEEKERLEKEYNEFIDQDQAQESPKVKSLVDFYSEIIVRAGKELIDYMRGSGIITPKGITKINTPKEKEDTSKTPETIPKVELNVTNGNILKVVEIIVLEKSYKVKNKEGLVAFIGKSLIDSVDLNNNILTLKNTSKWLLEDKKDGTPNIKWSEDTYNG